MAADAGAGRRGAFADSATNRPADRAAPHGASYAETNQNGYGASYPETYQNGHRAAAADGPAYDEPDSAADRPAHRAAAHPDMDTTSSEMREEDP
jgi:hypothetical protein